MIKKLNYFVLLLLLSLISFTSADLRDEGSEPIEITIGSIVEYDINKNYFKFTYSGSNDESIYFCISREYEVTIHLTDPKENRIELDSGRRYYSSNLAYQANLTYEGTYYLEIKCGDIDCIAGGRFTAIIPGRTIETIDFTKNIYFNKIDFNTDTNHSISTYKVNKPTQNKYVYFHLLKEYSGYYPYYFDEEVPYSNYDYEDPYKDLTIFEVCDQQNECTKNVKLFEFKRNVEYTIKIHFMKLKNYYDYYYDPKYYHPRYMFFPISQSNFKNINVGDSNVYSLDIPTFFIFNTKSTSDKIYKYISTSELEEELVNMYYVSTSETISYDNPKGLYNLNFMKKKGILVDYTDTNDTIVLVYSSDYESKAKFYIVDDVIQTSQNVYTIPAKKAKLIYNRIMNKEYNTDDYYDDYSDQNDKYISDKDYTNNAYEKPNEYGGVDSYSDDYYYRDMQEYYISIIKSSKNNIRLAFSEETEGKDVIIQNYYPFFIYAPQESSNYDITVTNYLVKYAIFGAVDPYYYKSFYKLGAKYLKSLLGIDIESYLKLSQANFRINTKYIPFYEFYNLYLNGIDVKLNIYIRQLYGGTELYECDPDGINLNDLTRLTTPINKAKCKNRKSIINRLFNFNGEKIISGYIAPDSYLDVYAEIDKDTDSIDINPLLISKLSIDSTAKYLLKDKVYKMNFHASHLIKLEPGYNAKITITNDRTTTIITPQYPTAEVSGYDYTIKAENDNAMVYFIGKLPSVAVKQIKIENKEGYYLNISNVEDTILFDFSFEGYLPSTYPLNFRVRDSQIVYIENIYSKLKRQLVQGEYLYLYYFANNNKELKIEYIKNNINIKNSDYNIFYIPKNEELYEETATVTPSTLIINTNDLRTLENNIKFCNQEGNKYIALLLTNDYEEKTMIKGDGKFYLSLFRGDNKLSFVAAQSFIYSYSFNDILDEDFFNVNQNWKNDRVELKNLEIIEVKDENTNTNRINIKFRPNYKNSTTRYIFIVGKKNDTINEEKFKDYCYLVELLNKRPEGFKIDHTYDIGDGETINAVIDISSISEQGKNQEFVVNIISQELRYNKSINFYIPKEFPHTGKQQSDDDDEVEPSNTDDDTEPSIEAIPIKIGDTVLYNISRNYFKFEKSDSENSVIYICFKDFSSSFYLTNANGEEIEMSYKESRSNIIYKVNLNKQGTYYIKIECDSFDCLTGNTFTTIVLGNLISEIDFTEKFYSNKIDIKTNTNHSISTYNVKKLDEDKNVYFTMILGEKDDIKYYYYPYYSDEQTPYPYDHNYYDNYTIFEVCDENNKCEKNVNFYHFKSGASYTIKIHFFKFCYDYEFSEDDYYSKYYHARYIFFPITKDNIKNIGVDDSGIMNDNLPTFYIFNNDLEKTKYVTFSELEEDLIIFYHAKTTDNININNLTKLANLPFKKREMITVEPDGINTIILVISSDFESETKFYIVDEIVEKKRDSYVIPAKTSQIIYSIDDNERDEEHINPPPIPENVTSAEPLELKSETDDKQEDGENEDKPKTDDDDKKEESSTRIKSFYISTFHTEGENMRLALSEKKEGTNLLIQNYYPFGIFTEKRDTNYTINVKNYLVKYALFAAVDDYYYQSFYKLGTKYLKSQFGIDIESYLTLSQANFRINTKLLPFFEFYNIYLNGIGLKLNLFIRQIYGGTELYECEPDGISVNDLTRLTTPINKAKCKNRKTLINRLFNFNGEKIISGYIAPDSYLDVYAEIDKDTKSIDINPLLISKLSIDSTAKYLLKDVEYKMNFHASHLIKLEPGYNAKITIKNSRTSTSITPQNPTTEVSGTDFTIKSNNNALVYFIGKLPTGVAKQIKIENKEGYYLKISNVEDTILFDFSFEGYLPSTYPLDFHVRENHVVYLENIYDKLKKRLVQNEYLYLYHFANKNKDLAIDYVKNNLNISNNDYNIYYIPKTDDIESTLIINTNELTTTINNIKFCNSNTKIEISLISEYENKATITNEGQFNMSLFRGDNKLSFSTNQPFIYSYSFYDVLDEGIVDKDENWRKDRVELKDLKINEVKDENTDSNKMNINFKPNYKNSTTRYIIIVGKKNETITKEKFDDHCYIAQLLNERPDGIKIDHIYDIGDGDTINGVIDISSISEKNKEQDFIITIISQELRYDKKINFYEAFEFSHKGKESSEDDDGSEDEGDIPTDQHNSKNGDDDSSGTTLALAIVLPILGVIIIAGVVFFILRRKNQNTSEQIEKLM